ncbi:methionyl-tRNA formyltransferase, partial [Arthrobacter sp. HMWF013]
MRVLFAGTPAVAVPSLNALVKAGFEVVAVLT